MEVRLQVPLAGVSATVAVGEPSQVGEARRVVAAAARRLGFGETDAGNAAIVATEAATNLLKHAGGGQVLVRALQRPDADERATRGLEILALDRGPGIRDLAECLRDGYTTAGTLGTGLGAIRRLSSTFDIYSAPGLGTALLSHLWPSRSERRPGSAAEAGAVCVAHPGEKAPGDGFAFRPLPNGFRLLVADGLGHGPLARDAAVAATAAFDAHPDAPPAALLELCHGALQATRGAAVAVAEADFAAGSVRFAGIGNIAGVVLGERGSQSMVSMNGTVGQGSSIRAREFVYSWSGGSLLVMCSDGLATRWSLDAYPGLVTRHPSLVAGVLYRDHARGRDDATAVAVREHRREPPA